MLQDFWSVSGNPRTLHIKGLKQDVDLFDTNQATEEV